jgi:hypothetical protein
MRDRMALVITAVFLFAALLAVPAGGHAGNSQNPPAKSVTCSFSNPSYSGWCRETRPVPEGGSAEQVCQDILSCLNNVQCGENLCNSTQIRGGWKIEKVEVTGGGN